LTFLLDHHSIKIDSMRVDLGIRAIFMQPASKFPGYRYFYTFPPA